MFRPPTPFTEPSDTTPLKCTFGFAAIVTVPPVAPLPNCVGDPAVPPKYSVCPKPASFPVTTLPMRSRDVTVSVMPLSIERRPICAELKSPPERLMVEFPAILMSLPS
jgi:hypothetical protein